MEGLGRRYGWQGEDLAVCSLFFNSYNFMWVYNSKYKILLRKIFKGWAKQKHFRNTKTVYEPGDPQLKRKKLLKEATWRVSVIQEIKLSTEVDKVCWWI